MKYICIYVCVRFRKSRLGQNLNQVNRIAASRFNSFVYRKKSNYHQIHHYHRGRFCRRPHLCLSRLTNNLTFNKNIYISYLNKFIWTAVCSYGNSNNKKNLIHSTWLNILRSTFFCFLFTIFGFCMYFCILTKIYMCVYMCVCVCIVCMCVCDWQYLWDLCVCVVKIFALSLSKWPRVDYFIHKFNLSIARSTKITPLRYYICVVQAYTRHYVEKGTKEWHTHTFSSTYYRSEMELKFSLIFK